MNYSDEQIAAAVAAYPKAVTGVYAECKNPAAVLRWALSPDNPHDGCRRLAGNFVESHHGTCWNGMMTSLPANGWLRWYAAVAKK